MPHADYYQFGGFNAYCSLCNGTFKASELRKHWQGMWRCQRCWEPRQPQDFVKAGPPEQPLPFVQPPNDIFIENVCTLNGNSAIPGYSIPGCMIPGNPVTLNS